MKAARRDSTAYWPLRANSYVLNSLVLMLGVAAGTLLIGLPTAWLTSMCEFPGRRVFEWTLLLPMAIPAYIIAYTYRGLLDFAGPLQSGLRELFGFLVPAAQLSIWALDTFPQVVDASFCKLIEHSVMLAAAASIIALLLALFMGYGRRLHPGPIMSFAVRLSGVRYAIPGTVIAVGVMLPFAWFDNTVDAWMRVQFDVSTGLLLCGTLVVLLFAYAVRFLAYFCLVLYSPKTFSTAC